MKTTGVMQSSKGRILFVEDEKLLLDMYHDFFERNGYDFLSTGNIKDALDVTMFEQPDVVLLDIIISKPENTVAEHAMALMLGLPDWAGTLSRKPKTISLSLAGSSG